MATPPDAARPRLLILGAGDRGTGYAALAAEHGWAEVVGVAEPRADRRRSFAARHGLPGEACAEDGLDLVERAAALGADAAVVATPDRVHREPAIACARAGLHLLLEKPMAPTEAGCAAIVAEVRAAGVMLAVGHVLRYTAYTEALLELLREGVIGELVSVQHLEPVGHWHMAHSFVRGNWRNEAGSAPMLLAKSCHDIDWLRCVAGRPCRRVSSFGSLNHFRADRRPAEATARCHDCPLRETCAYSAPRIYGRFLNRGETGWPLSVLATDTTRAGIEQALREGPYGRCVYACDNDVVDHQVVNLEFDGGLTAGFTMTAFAGGGRRTSLFGTQGEIRGDSRTLRVTDFRSGTTREIDTGSPDSTRAGGHGGGDGGLIRAFCRAVASGDPSHIRSGPEETLESHRIVFAAERARREGRVVSLDTAWTGTGFPR